MTHRAICEVCGASAPYLSTELAQAAAVVHVRRLSHHEVRCDAPLETVTSAMSALFRHGGHGATRTVTQRFCAPCRYWHQRCTVLEAAEAIEGLAARIRADHSPQANTGSTRLGATNEAAEGPVQTPGQPNLAVGGPT